MLAILYYFNLTIRWIEKLVTSFIVQSNVTNVNLIRLLLVEIIFPLEVVQNAKVPTLCTTWNLDENSIALISNVDANIRMHSRRMRAVHCSGRLRGKGVCPGQCLSGGGVSVEGWGVCLGGACPGVCFGGSVCPGVSAKGCMFVSVLGVCIPTGNGADIPPTPLTEFLTHTCENITFPQLLVRTVIQFMWMHRMSWA